MAVSVRKISNWKELIERLGDVKEVIIALRTQAWKGETTANVYQ